MTTLGDRLNAYVAKYDEIKDAEEVVKGLKAEYDDQELVLLDEFAEAGIQNMKTKSGRTVYLFQDLYVKLVGDATKAYAAVRRAGGTDMIHPTIHSSTLRSWIKELVASEKGVPKGLQPYVETTDAFKIRVRSS